MSKEAFENAIKNATSNQSTILILKLDTPGGLDSSMRKIVQLLIKNKLIINISDICNFV